MYQVAREFCMNDRGIQMHSFAASLAARAAGQEVPDDGYHGQYIVDWAAEMPTDVDPLEWGYTRALAAPKSALESRSIHFHTWFRERSMIRPFHTSHAAADPLCVAPGARPTH